MTKEDIMSENKKNMNDFILEAREVGLENLGKRKELTASLVDLYVKNNYKDVTIVACGSSSNASNCAKVFMRDVLDAEVKVVSPFTFEHYENKVSDDTMVFVISQSGYSTNSISALDKLRAMGKQAIGITGDVNSDMKDHCDLLVDYGVGVETVGYVTKGVVTLCEYLMLFALEAALRTGRINEERYQYFIDQIELAFTCHKEMYDATLAFYEKDKKVLLSMPHDYACSCGAAMGPALEGALKIGETIQIPSFAYEIEEYIHGPNLQLTPNYPVFFIDNHDETSSRIAQIYDATSAVSDKTFMISNNRKGDRIISIEHATCPNVAPLYEVVPFQYLAYKVTTELKKWSKHPMFKEFDKIASSKSENYRTNSPLATNEDEL